MLLVGSHTCTQAVQDSWCVTTTYTTTYTLLQPTQVDQSLLFLDKEAVQALDAQIKELRKQAGELGLLFAGRYLSLIGKHEKAREYIDRAIKLNSSNKQVSKFSKNQTHIYVCVYITVIIAMIMGVISYHGMVIEG